MSGAPERNRTSDARFRKPTLYPLSYRGAWVQRTIEASFGPSARELAASIGLERVAIPVSFKRSGSGARGFGN